MGLRRIIRQMTLVDRLLARPLAALSVMALLLLPMSGSAGVHSVSGEAACCAGMAADANTSQGGPPGVELPAGGPCATGCSGALMVYPPSCGASLRHSMPHFTSARLTGHDAPPDPFPPKISAVA